MKIPAQRALEKIYFFFLFFFCIPFFFFFFSRSTLPSPAPPRWANAAAACPRLRAREPLLIQRKEEKRTKKK